VCIDVQYHADAGMPQPLAHKYWTLAALEKHKGVKVPQIVSLTRPTVTRFSARSNALVSFMGLRG